MKAGTEKTGTTQKLRFFFALRPDRATAAKLATLAVELAGRHGGRPLTADDIHLTLAFVGMRERDEQMRLESILDGLPAQIDVDGKTPHHARHMLPDEVRPIRLQRFGTFGHGVIWIGPAAPGSDGSDGDGFARQIADAIRARLHAAHVDFDSRPLMLHATLVRGARRAAGGEAMPANAASPVAAHDRGARAPAIVAHAWSLALGFSGGTPPAGRRYQWSHPMPQ